MEGLWEAGIQFILWLQNLGDWLIVPMKFITFLGQEEFFFFILPLIYWCLDAGLGLQVGYILIISNGLNFIFKLLFHDPRPFWISPLVQPLAGDTTFGIPSGHAQNAVSIWGLIAVKLGRRPFYLLGFGAAFLIGLSRLVLGMHFPHDVLVGWLIGGALLWGFIRLWKPVTRWLLTKSILIQLSIAFVSSLILAGIGYGIQGSVVGQGLPQAWIANALKAGGESPDPYSMEGVITSAGTLFGFAFGAALVHRMGGYHTEGPVWKRFLRYIIGIIGILILWRGLGFVFPRGEDFTAYLFRYLRYSLVGLWIVFGAPLLYFHFSLASRPRPEK